MLIIDRIEGNFAVVEAEDRHLDIPLSEIEGTPKEGDVLKKTDRGYIIDYESTAARRKRIWGLQNSIFKKK